MINWLGQEIKVGDIVYRGARDGDSSSFKIGTVIKVYPDKQKARVEWSVEQRGQCPEYGEPPEYGAYKLQNESIGICLIHTLFLCPDDFIDKLDVKIGRY